MECTRLACGVLLSGVIGSTALAQPEPVDNYFPDRLSGWRFELEPFGLLPVDIDGTIQVGDRQVPFNADLGDVFDRLDFALNGRFEAWKQRWGIILNGQHYWLGSEFTTPDGMTTFEHNTRIGVGSALIARRFGAYDINDRVSFSVDAEAGVWLGRIHSTLEMSDGFSRTQNEIFPKAMLVARPILRITPSWAVINRNSITMPDISWMVMLGAEYDWRFLAFELGYFAERIVLAKDVVTLAADAHGPYLGVAFRWGSGRPY
ncbi:MAG TPA: hypothetical protein VFV99_24170 [Kofleriaceae bacterium]|nr:hypothetical protein [Kofleriaceae bacterium]